MAQAMGKAKRGMTACQYSGPGTLGKQRAGVRFCGFCIGAFKSMRLAGRMINTTTNGSVDFSLPPRHLDGTPAPGSPEAGEVRRQVQRILASKDFISSPRNRRFLQHVVERSLEGVTVRGYEIGTLVFGRPKTFNATSDPIVRIEAGKLRRDLETYYLKSGRQDPIRISLPKGGYRAVFTRNETPVGEATASPGGLLILRAALLGLAGGGAEAAEAWRGVEREYPDFALNPQAHKALDAVHMHNDRVRELLIEGLRRAARPAGHARTHEGLNTGAVTGAAAMTCPS